MTEALLYRLSQLTGRERALLAVLLVVCLPLAAVFGVIVPLQEARSAAQAEVADARALRAWVESQAAALPPEAFRQAPQDAGTAGTGPIGISGIEQTLVAAGLRPAIDRLANRRGGGIEIAFQPVRFDAFTAWLDAASRGWGYDIAALRVERADTPGHVTAELVLEARR
jgi:type II secretory pathway component PulM